MTIIGHQKILNLLKRANAAKRLAHGLCFVGPSGVGKRQVALWLAGQLLGTNEPQKHADFFMVERERDEKTDIPKHEINIEQIRRLREQLFQTSFFSGHKIAVIDEAETLSRAAANALLKTLEEPPGKTNIILVTTSLESLPATIASRVQTFQFQPVSVEEMMKADISENHARLAVGKPGVALSLCDEEQEERYMALIYEFNELVTSPIWKRAKIIEGWFGKKKAHIDSVTEMRDRLRLWKTLLRESMFFEVGASELVGSRLLRDNIPHAHELLLRLLRLEELVAANANARYALEACFLI